MARFQDTDEADGKDGRDVAGHRNTSDTGEPEPAGAAPRRPKYETDDEDDTEGHLYGGGPSTQGEAFPHPHDNPHGDR